MAVVIWRLGGAALIDLTKIALLVVSLILLSRSVWRVPARADNLFV